MSTKSYELSVQGLDVPDGQITFAQLAELANGLQELILRIGRQLDERSRPGRTPQHLGRAAEVRLSGLQVGSTRLLFEVGDPESFDLPEQPADLLASRFEEIVRDIGQNEPPEWADGLVAQSAERVARAFSHLGQGIRLARHDEKVVQIAVVLPAEVEPTVWRPAAAVDELTEPVSVSGRLEAVDLATHRFRVRDDSGRAITLLDVVDAEAAGRLVGARVIAGGIAHRDANGILTQVREPTLRSQLLAGEPDESPIVTQTNAPDVEVRISDDELEQFLAELRA